MNAASSPSRLPLLVSYLASLFPVHLASRSNSCSINLLWQVMDLVGVVHTAAAERSGKESDYRRAIEARKKQVELCASSWASLALSLDLARLSAHAAVPHAAVPHVRSLGTFLSPAFFLLPSQRSPASERHQRRAEAGGEGPNRRTQGANRGWGIPRL